MVLAGHGLKGQVQPIARFTPMLTETKISGRKQMIPFLFFFFHDWNGHIFHPTEIKFAPLHSASRPLAHHLLFVAVAVMVFH